MLLGLADPGRMLTLEIKPLRNVHHVDHMMVSTLVLIYQRAKREQNIILWGKKRGVDPPSIMNVCPGLNHLRESAKF